ncbi:cytochrome P450 71D8-like [Senna tora]|uniref:Cytochrome P450 71D8-like n=1 Tax=Senna tora TaxID=362788 RepID=A0A834W0A7_9FABA|nr:cytochrome P450 71D8-like [Senna tora]
MEFQYSFFSIIFFLFLLLWLAKKYKQHFRTKSSIHKLPPGPWKLPLIGNLHQLAKAGSHPHHALRELSLKHGPLMHLQLGEISAVVVSSPEMAKEIMRTHDLTFVQRPELLCPKMISYGYKGIAFTPYGEYWRQMRKICTLELLSPKRVQSFSFVREDEVTKLIKSIQMCVGSPINLSTRISSMVSTLVCRAAFGKKSDDIDELRYLLKKAIEVSGGFDLVDLFPSLKPIHLLTRTEVKLEKMHKKLDEILEKIVNEHQLKMKSKDANGNLEKENLVDVLLRVQRSGDLNIPITGNNIKAVIWDIFAAGSESSASVIEWAMSELMRNPRVMEKAQAEIREAFRGKKTIHEKDVEELSYLKLVIKETMRLHTPGPLLLPRECREACNIGGYEIPIKTKVIVNAWALGRDPKYWYDAESFIPERFCGSSVDFKGTNFEYIPFGSGRRMCPGISFALASIELPLACLLYHFDWELPNGMKPVDLDMTETFGAAIGRKNKLYLIPSPCVPPSHYHAN